MAHQGVLEAHVGVALHLKLLFRVSAQPDLALDELQSKLHCEAGVSLRLLQIWKLLRKLSVRL